jgi:hypothetical protein
MIVKAKVIRQFHDNAVRRVRPEGEVFDAHERRIKELERNKLVVREGPQLNMTEVVENGAADPSVAPPPGGRTGEGEPASLSPLVPPQRVSRSKRRASRASAS